MPAALQTVDHSALKVNQTGIVVTVLVAFIGGIFYKPLELLIPLLAIVLLLGTFVPQLALFKQLYFKVLKPRASSSRVRSRTVLSRTTSRRASAGSFSPLRASCSCRSRSRDSPSRCSWRCSLSSTSRSVTASGARSTTSLASEDS